jgi:hypothetical protein
VEGNSVAQVKGLAAGPSTRVQVEFLTLLIHVQQLVKIAMGKEDVAP